jgi:asparagine synthase (glutamine-hydrolysing)
VCGIYGVVWPEEPGEERLCSIGNRMGAHLAHRGPDSQGIFHTSQVLLGSNRLSIVDVENGYQPMVRGADGRRCVIVYNGEVYNHAELRRDLAARGVHTETRCDTEVVLLAYMVFGESCVESFDGQFAFAIWDEKERKLFLARDPAGIKPLFYATLNGCFVFASEPKAVLKFPGAIRRPNLEAIGEYFLHGYAFASGYVTGERTFYEGVSALLPGHTLRITDGITRQRCYWRPPVPESDADDITGWGHTVRETMEKRIADYVSQEVALGVALSGGVDSSIVTSLAVREMNRQGKDLTACTIYYAGEQPNYDYENAVTLVAAIRSQGNRLRFERSVLSPADYLTDLDAMLWHFDEPHWEVKQLAMFRNYRRLKESGAKVILTGEGADELFFGYYQKFPGFRNPRLVNAKQLRDLWGSRVGHVLSIFSDEARPSMNSLLKELMDKAIEQYYMAAWDQEVGPEKRMQHWYFRTFLPWLLTVNDRCSMAFSLEGRFPFLDKELINLAFRMPASINTTGVGKNVLRESFSDLLPESIRVREKAPLPSPLDVSFHRVIHQAFEQEIERSRESPVWEILDRRFAENLARRFGKRLDELTSGTEPLTSYMYLNEPLEMKTVHVFSLLTLLRWYHLNFHLNENVFLG